MRGCIDIWGAVPLEILKDPEISRYGLAVYISIGSFQGVNESCTPSLVAIAQRACVSRRQVVREIELLVRKEWIEKQRRGNQLTNRYRVRYPLVSSEVPNAGTTSEVPNVDTSEVPNAGTSEVPQCRHSKTTKKTTLKTPPLGAEEKALYHLVEDLFRETPGYDFKREGAAVKRLVRKALVWPRGSPEEFLRGVITVYRGLVYGKDAFWKKQPFLPSALDAGGIWPRVLKEIENRAGKQRDIQQAFSAHKPIWGK